MLCPVCKNIKTSNYINLYDDRYGYPGVFFLNKCLGCSHIYITKNFKDNELIRLYSDFYPRSKFDISQHAPHETKGPIATWLNGDLRSAYRWVPEKVRVLDIGCGFGESLAYHKLRGCDVYGVEADENIKRVADKHGYNVHIGLFDPGIYEPDFFDYVTMDQVLEHVVKPLETLKGVSKILKPEGRVVLSVPNPQGWGVKVFGKYWINWHAPYHLHHYSRKSMSIVAKSAGLKIVEVSTITSSSWLYFQWKHLITYPEAECPSDFWTGKKISELSRFRQILYLTAWAAHKMKVNHILTRLFDALRVGDSHVFILEKTNKD